MAFDWPDLRVCPSSHPKVHTHARSFISREEIQLQSVGFKVRVLSPDPGVTSLSPGLIAASLSFTIKQG